MQITHKQTEAERKQEYRARAGDVVREREAARMRTTRAKHIPQFVGVDSEGIGHDKNHRAVLLGVGETQYVARDMRKGLQWKEVFEFLYQEFEKYPADTVFVGFYLSYDFNSWMRSLPRKAAVSLYTGAGKAARRIPDHKNHNKRHQYYPVRVDGWEVDMLGDKRLSIRPRVCMCLELERRCTHEQKPWMSVCDAGSYFQTSFLNVLKDWPEVRSQEEFDKVEYGKRVLRVSGRLTKAMREYNVLENLLLGRVMTELCKGFKQMGIHLARDEWYGPGSTAGKWLTKNGGVRRKEAEDLMPAWFLGACQKSYFGGWFEIFSHGIINGESHNYDINSAYPFATTRLPHICESAKYSHGNGRYKGSSEFVLLLCTVSARNPRIGPVPHRDKHGHILRPNHSKGWYWAHELAAARRAGLVDNNTLYHEWVAFDSCDHDLPFSAIGDLYDQRQSVGKDTPLGKAIKLIINSIYGKFAQSIGNAPFNNWFYASFITSHTRMQILDAIATHPRKSKAVLMVATDGIAFDSAHPSLPVSPKKLLGEWDHTVYKDLCLFKPGVYWHHEGKESLLKIKSRGVPQKEFAEGVEKIEMWFAALLADKMPPGYIQAPEKDDEPEWYELARRWPWFGVHVNFRMKSCKQALNEGKWEGAGVVQEKVGLFQSSDPSNKRLSCHYNAKSDRFDSYIHELDRYDCETRYYKDPTIEYAPHLDLGVGMDGEPEAGILEAVTTARDKKSQYDIDLGNVEWETIWDGGTV